MAFVMPQMFPAWWGSFRPARRSCRTSVGVAALLVGATATAQQDVQVNWLSFAQLTAEHTDTADGVSFGRDRVRIKVEATAGRLTGTGTLDFGPTDLGDEPPGTLANVVADLYVTYQLGGDYTLRAGQFKTPFGMDFNVPGHELDLAKRGMEADLVFNRDLGLLFSGRRNGKALGYDLGVFNPAGRSGATRYEADQVGDANAVIGRIYYDVGQWHGEASHGKTAAAGGFGTSAYEATDAAVRYRGAKWNTKVEWLEGRGVRGDAARTENVYYVHGAYSVSPTIELVARHYAGRSNLAGTATRLTNSYLGTSWRVFATPRMNGRLQANYVVAGRDAAEYSGVGGYRDNTLLLQFQLYAQK